MKKFVLFNFLLLLLFGCKDDTNMIKCKGIPDINQAFAYMYFKTEYEGYLFGTYTEYDLLYSLDKGKTWQIKKLEESNYVRPNCLINNIVYIYSGGARMQKIVL